ncbi:protein kinase, putative [Trypanosoma cruzi]|uniref:non-specific serine/threonine protein kinase n=1 Tax=Trypanosoma cruzi (strain CL Brener) TaxID=353153 RepID=Q4D211_TRYCC|nr:protein kinase, putative [Trypanosoma cruzi]EAN86563.1 protein kinase, putative [Trypanosoma cruzi]|eukprot:XP_808414.1 protein kinase [Trypanosoma cruzi strain CL Brener]
MLPHPILATEDDRDYIERSILSMQEHVENFFALLELVYLESKSEQTPRAHALFHSIQSTLKVLGTVPSSSYRKNDSKLTVDEELPKGLERMRRLFFDVVTVGPESLVWKKPVTRLAQEAAQHAKNIQIKFPSSSTLVRKGVSRNSFCFLLLILIFVSALILALVTMVVIPFIGPSPSVAAAVGILSAVFLVGSGSCIIFCFVMAVRALQELFDRLLGERMHANLIYQPSSGLSDEASPCNTTTNQLRVKRGRDTRRGYYAIPYGDCVGYIEGKHVDAHVVMIGFDSNYLITRWNMAAEVMTGFLEGGCIGKPLSDLLITPSGDVPHDLSTLQASKGDVLKVKLRAFATAPVTLCTIAAPILNLSGKTIGSILICANAKDNLGVFRSYIRDYLTSEVSVSLSELVEKNAVDPQGKAAISSLQSFLTCALDKQVQEMAREMLTEWEWTTAEQLLAQALRSFTVRHEKQIDSMFPATLCLHPNVPKAISTLLDTIGVSCMVKLEVMSQTVNVFALAVTITPHCEENELCLNEEELQDAIMPLIRSICGNMCKDGKDINLRFPCQVTAFLEDGEDAFKAIEKRGEQSIIDQTRAIVNCTVNVLALITDLVDQHNLSMILLKTMFVSLTTVRQRDDLERRLKAAPNDVDVIICDRGWLNSARDLIISSDHSAIVVPMADQGVFFAPEEFQYVIRSPISGNEVRKVLMDIGTAVSLRKNAATAREERERILTLRQDSPWTKGKLLGRGSFGAVYEAMSDLTGGKMAVKMFYFSADCDESINKLLNEIRIMCSLNHPNIVHYFHCERKENNINLFMELCDASLGEIIIGRKPVPPTLTVVQILRQVLTALTYLHTRGVAHRDVKPQNILLKGDTIKITDFGTAREGKASKDVQGTLRYMAPEVYRGEAHSSPCDIWSVGCLACELFACPPKFMDNSLILAEMTSAVPYLENVTSSVTLNDFLRKCFQDDPEKRPTAADLLLHSIFSPEFSYEVESLLTVFKKKLMRNYSFSITSQK